MATNKHIQTGGSERVHSVTLFRNAEALDQDLVSSHADLQEGLAPEFKLGRLHLRASLLCISEDRNNRERSQFQTFVEAFHITAAFSP